MPPLHHDHFVDQFTLKSGKLTFNVEAQTAYYARQAMAFGIDFTACLSTPEGLKEVTGKIQIIKLVLAERPLRWEIVMRVTTEHD
jgi:hypothetical protein